MEEVFPILAGIVIGLAAVAVPRAFRAAFVAVFGVVFGLVAAWVSGELMASWIYAVVDTAQVLGAAIATAWLVPAWSRRRARSVAR